MVWKLEPPGQVPDSKYALGGLQVGKPAKDVEEAEDQHIENQDREEGGVVGAAEEVEDHDGDHGHEQDAVEPLDVVPLQKRIANVKAARHRVGRTVPVRSMRYS